MTFLFTLPSKEKTYRKRTRLDDLSDEQVVQISRMPRDAVQFWCNMLQDKLEHPSSRSHALPVDTQILIAFEFYSSGSFQWMVGGASGVAKATVSRTIENVTNSICDIAPKYIFFQSHPSQLNRMKLEFAKMAGFPNVVGAIDGTHIPILAPSQHEDAYVNRKGGHSINVQAACDAQMCFTDVVVKWPGATHDAFMWRNCGLREKFTNGTLNNCWLLGDSGYPLEPWLLTPFSLPSSPGEEAFNSSQTKTRSIIERSFGVLKSRFRCLDKTGGTLLYTPQKACKIIVACFVLHNFCTRHHIQEPIVDPQTPENTVADIANVNDNRSAVDLRRHLVDTIFS